MTLLHDTATEKTRTLTTELIPCEAVCEFCDQKFTRELPLEEISSTPMRFCSRKHAVLAAKGVTYVPGEMDAPAPVANVKTAPKPGPRPAAKTKKTPCPTPGKQKFETRALADRRAILASGTYGFGMRPYECPCGSYHLSSKPARW